MRRKAEWMVYMVFFLLVIPVLLLCAQSDGERQASSGLRLSKEQSSGPVPLYLKGEYRLDGGAYLPLTQDTEWDVLKKHTLVIRGHFSRDIPEHMQLMLRLSNVTARLSVNGRTVYTNQKEKGFSRSPGNGWVAVASPGILMEDTVELTLSNVYVNGNPQTFSHAAREMYAGYESDLARLILKESAGSILFAFLTVPLGFLLLFAGIVIPQLNRRRIFALALFCLSVGTWILTDPNFAAFLADSPEVILALSQISQFLQLVSITGFVYTIVQGRVKTGVGVICGCSALLFVTASLCQLFGVRDYYDFTRITMVMTSIVCVTMLAALVTEAARRNVYARKTLLSILPLGIFSLSEQAAWALGFYYKGFFTQLGFLIFLGVQAVYTVKEAKTLIYRLERAQRTENELIKSRISLMLSQIQPHFLFNCLTAIRQLCDSEPEKASEALTHFSRFLRVNVDALSCEGMIPFGLELAYVKDYFYLEQMRFTDRLKLELELETEDFYLPPLTLQPMVENAVRHGLITKRKEQPRDWTGTVTVLSRRVPGAVLLTVEDDGIGLEAVKEQENGASTHVGIENVRKRLQMQCGGSLTIRAREGGGTTVTMLLPQEEKTAAAFHQTGGSA